MMDAVEFLKAQKRLCNSVKRCDDCPLYMGLGACRCATSKESDECEVVSTVEQWGKEHPIKTRQSEFLKMFPNAMISDDGVLSVMPCDIDKTIKRSCEEKECDDCYRDYWLKEVK